MGPFTTLRLTRVSGPIQCMVGPLAKSEEASHVVTTHVVTSSEDFLGLVPSSAPLEFKYSLCQAWKVSQ